MGELETYDEAVANYCSSSGLVAMPLMSWDIHMENYSMLTSFREDLVSIEAISKNWSFKRDYLKEFTLNQSVIVVTSPELRIVYASRNIKKMNGYTPKEILGKSPKIFQGEATCDVISEKIRRAVMNQEPFEETVVNYRKDLSLYNCRIKGFPVFNKKGVLVNYIAFEHVA